MLKKATVFNCNNCGYESLKWLGKCPACGGFNSFSEEAKELKKKGGGEYRGFDAGFKTGPLKDVETGRKQRISTGISEADRVFGGGIVKGSLALLGGEPGAGKSTMALAISENVAKSGRKVIYISGEESPGQIKMRADRTGAGSPSLFVASETCVERIAEEIEREKPSLVVVDSIQTVYKDSIDALAGSVSQIKESCAHLMYAAKKTGVPVIIIGHVTKDGSIAGPKMLEHMVDVVLYFESEQINNFKVLRAVKNRFGSTNEIGVFEMGASGITEVASPSKILLDGIKEQKAGSGIVTVMEGTRPLMLEIQALTARRNFGNPQRTVTGVDYNRFLIILAVLEKKMGLSLENQDVFVNVAGGIRIFETGSDLGLAAAVYSGFRNSPVSTKTVYIGELGLDGEVRPVHFMDLRIAEAERMGFERAVIPARSKTGETRIKLERISSIEELKKIIITD
ncbi:MAG TPA: DNA repair protein RadA [bacterium]|nr:DNA repair protein RadA [bacterium]